MAIVDSPVFCTEEHNGVELFGLDDHGVGFGSFIVVAFAILDTALGTMLERRRVREGGLSKPA
ncbi:MAG: hypothetical protein IPL41_11840 [Micropruina sp.]|nr:hypothetical protein [Micropruina sp.]